jgi:hypothetical protein
VPAARRIVEARPDTGGLRRTHPRVARTSAGLAGSYHHSLSASVAGGHVCRAKAQWL